MHTTWPTPGLPRVDPRLKQPFGLVDLDVSTRLPATPRLILLGYPYFSPILMVPTLLDLFLVSLKVIEVILVRYFIFISMIVINL